MPRKGPPFEREICKRLSLWWTGGAEDFVFWRTSQSGGRATVRKRVGKRTRGHCGDVCAADPSGSPLTDLCTIELKRGYPKAYITNILDKPERLSQQPFEEFLEQAIDAAERGDTPYWMLIHKRDKRECMIYFPRQLYSELQRLGCTFSIPRVTMQAKCRKADGKQFRLYCPIDLFGTTLDNFLEAVDPMEIKAIARKHCVSPQH